MTDFTTHSIDTAPTAARPLLQAVQDSLGFVPNLYANLAEAPATLEAYLQLSALLEHTSLSPVERQVLLIAASVENGCEFCVAAHSMVARKLLKVPDAVVDTLRNGQPIADARLQALARFTTAMVRERGWVAGAELDAFLFAGYTQQQALEVVLGVSMKTLSNYANHLTGTHLNAELKAEAWSRSH